MSIDKDFAPYTESLELKELGVDEPCLGWYQESNYGTEKVHVDSHWKTHLSGLEDEDFLPAPTFSQAFKFFREKYGLYHHIVPEFYTKGINFNWQILWYLPEEEWTNHVISDGTGLYGDNGEYPTQEEAELACLRKLIEIVKQKS